MCLRTTSALARLETKAAGDRAGAQRGWVPPVPSPGQRGRGRPRTLTFGAGRVVGAGGAVSGCGAARGSEGSRGALPAPCASGRGSSPTTPHSKPSPGPPQPGEGSVEPCPLAPALRPPPAKPPRSPQSRLGAPSPPSPGPRRPPTPRTSAAEAEGEEGQEGQQGEGPHGACARGPGRVQPPLPAPLYRAQRPGGAAGLFPAHPPGPEPPAQAAIVVWGEPGPPGPGQSPQGRKGGRGPAEIRGGPSPAGWQRPAPQPRSGGGEMGRWGTPRCAPRGPTALSRSRRWTPAGPLPKPTAFSTPGRAGGTRWPVRTRGGTAGPPARREGEQVPGESWHRSLALQAAPPATVQAAPRNTLRKSLKPQAGLWRCPVGAAGGLQRPAEGFARPSLRHPGAHPLPTSPPAGH